MERDPVDILTEASRRYVRAFYRYHATYAKHRLLGWDPEGEASVPNQVQSAWLDMMRTFDRLCEAATGEPRPENWADPGVIDRYAIK